MLLRKARIAGLSLCDLGQKLTDWASLLVDPDATDSEDVTI